MPDQNVVEVTLNKATKGSGRLDLTFCITRLEYNEYDCVLTSIHLQGKPRADDLEIQLAQQNTAFKGQQTWTLKKPSDAYVEDDEENEIHLVLQNAVLRTVEGGEPMAKATVGEKGEGVLMTQNWKE
ncbi:MAG: hypothetical protein Q9157_004712 [Trypethelium eluteriae]